MPSSPLAYCALVLLLFSSMVDAGQSDSLRLSGYVSPATTIEFKGYHSQIPFSRDVELGQVINRSNSESALVVLISSQGGHPPYTVTYDSRPVVISSQPVPIYTLPGSGKPSSFEHSLRVRLPGHAAPFSDTLTLSIVAM
jgi:hypothetical protein